MCHSLVEGAIHSNPLSPFITLKTWSLQITACHAENMLVVVIISTHLSHFPKASPSLHILCLLDPVGSCQNLSVIAVNEPLFLPSQEIVL